jgi:hypothetical protein
MNQYYGQLQGANEALNYATSNNQAQMNAYNAALESQQEQLQYANAYNQAAINQYNSELGAYGQQNQNVNTTNNALLGQYQAGLLGGQVQSQKYTNAASSAQSLLKGVGSLLGGSNSNSINPSTSQSWSDMVSPYNNAMQASGYSPSYIGGTFINDDDTGD